MTAWLFALSAAVASAQAPSTPTPRAFELPGISSGPAATASTTPAPSPAAAIQSSTPTAVSTAVAVQPSTPPAFGASMSTPPVPAVLSSAPAAAVGAPPAPAPRHPLDPLDAGELALVSRLLREDPRFPEDGLFAYVALEEPAKSELDRYVVEGDTPTRRAFAVLLESARSRTHEAMVNLTKKKVERLAPKAGVQAPLLVSELASIPAAVRTDPAFREALLRRGVSDLSAVHLDVRPAGTVGVTGASGSRLARVLAFYKGKSSNAYARPIEGLVAVVDVGRRKVLRIDDTGEVPVSTEDGAFDEKVGTRSPAPKPLVLSQPDGPTFERRGSEVRWQGWTFRVALQPREGPVVYDAAFADGGKARMVLRRGSVSELVSAFGDPSPAWSWRGAFEEGERGLGRLASPLEAGTDVPAYATLLDVDALDDFGKPVVQKRAAALYERDAGLLWRHYARETDALESRRGRELVFGSIATIGGRDYALEWVFGQDGSIGFETRVTGVPLAKGVDGDAEDRFSQRLSTRIAAPQAQHFVNVRLDLDVDGEGNAVYEAATTPVAEGAEGNAFALELRPLKSEAKARRGVEPGESRRWLVASEDSRKDGRPAGYLLVPEGNTVPFARAGSAPRKRAGFLDAQFWATRYNPGELYAAGLYPNQADGAAGLPRYTQDDESLEGKDVVLWYTLGLTENPRPEDWPVMPALRGSVRLVPFGFFRRNPALTLPRPK